MSNLALRVLTAVVALPLLGALIVWQEPLGFGLLVIVVAGLALTEYVHLVLASAPRRLGAASTAVLLEPGELAGAGARLGLAGFGVLYLGLLPATLAVLHRDAPHGA